MTFHRKRFPSVSIPLFRDVNNIHLSHILSHPPVSYPLSSNPMLTYLQRYPISSQIILSHLTPPYHTLPYPTTPHHTLPHHTTPHHTLSHHTTPHPITSHHTTPQGILVPRGREQLDRDMQDCFLMTRDGSTLACGMLKKYRCVFPTMIEVNFKSFS